VALTDPDLFVFAAAARARTARSHRSTSIAWVPKGEHNERYLDEVRRAATTVLEKQPTKGLAPFQQALRQFEGLPQASDTRDDDPVARRQNAGAGGGETREVMAINATIQIRAAFEASCWSRTCADFLARELVRVLVAANQRESAQPG